MAGVPASRWTHYLIAAGILWAARQGADIINLSVSLRHDTPTLRRAVQYCWDHNILIVTSMGNLRKPGSSGTKTYPAGYAQTLAVGGVEKQGEEFKIWENSAAGPFVDIVAPAKDIWVEVPQYRGRPYTSNLRYGNSLASSFTAAAAALMLSAMPPESRQTLRARPGLLPETLRRIFHETASNPKLGFSSTNPLSGHGLIDILGALEKARVITGAPGLSPN
jgi:subtilisin family serine protease